MPMLVQRYLHLQRNVQDFLQQNSIIIEFYDGWLTFTLLINLFFSLVVKAHLARPNFWMVIYKEMVVRRWPMTLWERCEESSWRALLWLFEEIIMSSAHPTVLHIWWQDMASNYAWDFTQWNIWFSQVVLIFNHGQTHVSGIYSQDPRWFLTCLPYVAITVSWDINGYHLSLISNIASSCFFAAPWWLKGRAPAIGVPEVCWTQKHPDSDDNRSSRTWSYKKADITRFSEKRLGSTTFTKKTNFWNIPFANTSGCF